MIKNLIQMHKIYVSVFQCPKNFCSLRKLLKYMFLIGF